MLPAVSLYFCGLCILYTKLLPNYYLTRDTDFTKGTYYHSDSIEIMAVKMIKRIR